MDPVNTSLEQTLHQNAVDFNVDDVVTQIKQTVLSNGKIEGDIVNVSKVRQSPDTHLVHPFILCYFNVSCIFFNYYRKRKLKSLMKRRNLGQKRILSRIRIQNCQVLEVFIRVR